jgi:SAM-dependent methyltransferase
MHAEVFRTFERICAGLAVTGPALEIGVAAGQPALLDLPSLSGAARRIGVGLDPPFAAPGYEVLQRNAHDLSAFGDASFEIVLSNSMLEHDPHFWRSLAEMRRVLQPEGWLVIGVPGFAAMGTLPAARLTRRLLRQLARSPIGGRKAAEAIVALDASAPTLGLHPFPSDYYRFSAAAVAEVLLEGMREVRIERVLAPPRFVGIGRKPPGAPATDLGLP